VLTRLGIPRRPEDYLRADASTDLLGDVILQREDARQGAFERFAPKPGVLVGNGELRANADMLAAGSDTTMSWHATTPNSLTASTDSGVTWPNRKCPQPAFIGLSD